MKITVVPEQTTDNITGNVPHIEKRISGAALRKMCQKEYGEAADWYEN